MIQTHHLICQHSTVVVHPTCNRKVVGSNPTAGFSIILLSIFDSDNYRFVPSVLPQFANGRETNVLESEYWDGIILTTEMSIS